MARDGEWEQGWRDHLARRVEVLYGFSIAVLDRIIGERLAAARERYADDGYLHRDVLEAACGKTADAVALAMLEAEKQVELGHGPSLQSIEEAAIHLAVAEHYLRLAKRQRSTPT